MAAKPVVLGRDVRERALSGQRQRRNALGLVALQVGIVAVKTDGWSMSVGPGEGRARPRRASIWCRSVMPTLSTEEIRDVNTRYHDVAADHYDSKWGIDFGELGREQVLAKVRKALGRTARPLPPLA